MENTSKSLIKRITDFIDSRKTFIDLQQKQKETIKKSNEIMQQEQERKDDVKVTEHEYGHGGIEYGYAGKRKVGECEYVFWYMGEGSCVVHAGDCSNPIHKQAIKTFDL